MPADPTRLPKLVTSTIDNPTWNRSSFRVAATDGCVEVAKTEDGYLIRDSKEPDQRPLHITGDEWVAFVKGVKAGEFN